MYTCVYNKKTASRIQDPRLSVEMGIHQLYWDIPWGMRNNYASSSDLLHGSVASVNARIAEYKYQQ